MRMSHAVEYAPIVRGVTMRAGDVEIAGDLTIPLNARGIVVLALGSSAGRKCPRNRQASAILNHAGLATLLVDLLTVAEEVIDECTAQFRFDIPFLADRILAATDHLFNDADTADLPIGYFGASTGAAAALAAAALRPGRVHAVVARGGRPELAADYLNRVQAPTLLIVGTMDRAVLPLNMAAKRQMNTEVQIALVTGATNRFVEPGTLEEAARLTGHWCQKYCAIN